MNTAITAYLGLAALAANLPFISSNIFFWWSPKTSLKPFYWALIELLVLYVLFGAAGLWLESQYGPVHGQKWPFYATTIALFIVAAYPGFVFRYFWRKSGS